MNLTKIAQLTAIGLICSVQLGAEESARVAIEKQYLKATEATKLRYYDGCVSMRHASYAAFGPDGVRARLDLDEQRLKNILATAIHIDEKMQVLSFEKLSDSKVRCEIQDTLQFVSATAAIKDAQQVVLDTRCQDTWIRTRSGWRLLETKILKQDAISKPFVPNSQ